MRVTVDITNRDPEREAEALRWAEGQRVRAVILVGSRRPRRDQGSSLREELEAYEAGGGRVVMVSQPSLPFDTVVPDNRSGSAALARALTGMGYTRFAVIGWPAEYMASTERIEGFLAGLAEARISVPDHLVLRGEDGWDGGHRLTSQLVDEGLIGTGAVEIVFAVSDVMALGAVAALRERGLSVPDDVAIAGYGGAIGPSRLASSITTVQFALREIGTQAFTLATRWKQPGERAVLTVPATVMIRSSTPGR
jgi:LacI family transcriptional regulator